MCDSRLNRLLVEAVSAPETGMPILRGGGNRWGEKSQSLVGSSLKASWLDEILTL